MRAKLFRYWLWVPRLLAVALLFWAGGRNWLLGSYWHNVGMRFFQLDSDIAEAHLITAQNLLGGSRLSDARITALSVGTNRAKFSEQIRRFVGEFLPDSALECYRVLPNYLANLLGVNHPIVINDSIGVSDPRLTLKTRLPTAVKKNESAVVIFQNCAIVVDFTLSGDPYQYVSLYNTFAVVPNSKYKISFDYRSAGIKTARLRGFNWASQYIENQTTFQPAIFYFLTADSQTTEFLRINVGSGDGFIEIKNIKIELITQ